MQATKVVSLLNLNDEQLETVRQAVPGVIVRQSTHRPGQGPAPDVSDAEILLTFGLDFDLAQAPHLAWVQLASAGVDRFLDHPIMRSGIRLTTASGIHAIPIAEHIMALMLAWSRQLLQTWRWQAAQEWPAGRSRRYSATELRGATLGIVGYGSIGRHLARLARAFEMRVLAMRRSPGHPVARWVAPGTGDPEGEIPERIFAPGSLGDMLPLCDYVAITAPLSPETRHLIGAGELAAMKKSAFLVNISRGAVIDEPALIAALQDGTIAGAGLDVFETEPLPADSPLYKLDNVILTPHVAGFSEHYNDRLVQLFVENLQRYRDGQPLLNLVDPERGY